MLCLIINHSTILYFRILFVFLISYFPLLLFDCIYLFIALYIAVYVFIVTVLCYLVLWPQDWITTTTTITIWIVLTSEMETVVFWFRFVCVLSRVFLNYDQFSCGLFYVFCVFTGLLWVWLLVSIQLIVLASPVWSLMCRVGCYTPCSQTVNIFMPKHCYLANCCWQFSFKCKCY